MVIEKGIITESAPQDSSLADSQQQHRTSFIRQYLPLWLCLLLALIVRAWLVFHTRGVIDGDEAIVGIQALHILRGELPVYYIGQVYMGSLEAYLWLCFLLLPVPLYGHFAPNLFCLLLLISAFRLTQRWYEGASTRELALRWAGIGFVVGLGFWVTPLNHDISPFESNSLGTWVYGC